jgi:flagellar basal-body rod protein FlgG
MSRSLFSAASGMEGQQLAIETIANNLANVNTTGFKRSHANFHDLMYQTRKAPGSLSESGTIVPSGIQIGSGSRIASVSACFTQGASRQTGNELDLMIEGDGFFRIQKDDGSFAYTRDGSFKRDNMGRLVTADGFPLIPGIIIPANAGQIQIGRDGEVSGQINGQQLNLGRIQIVNFINPTGLSALGRNLYSGTDASGGPVEGSPNQGGLGPIAQGQLESSNVNVVEEMVNMITGQRAYEMNAKVIQTGRDMKTSSLKR